MKKFFKSPWTIGIGTTLLGFSLTVIYDLVKGKQLLATMCNMFDILKSWLIIFLNFELKVWWVLTGVAIIIIILLIISFSSDNSNNINPDFTAYTTDHFRLWRWSWRWEFNVLQKKWQIINLQAHCPQCDTPMISSWDEDYFRCPRCRFSSKYDDHEKSYEVEAIIIDNLNRRHKQD